MTAELLPMAKFRLGNIVTTPTAGEKLAQDDILTGIRRHQAGDWGEVADYERTENDDALEKGRRLHSVYSSANGVIFSLITEADRSVTTVSLAGLETQSVGAVQRFRRPVIAERSQIPAAVAQSSVQRQPAEVSAATKSQIHRTVRSLQIEEIGDRWKGFRPRIRIMGQWLERAGFKPGTRVSVICRNAGFIELRAFGSISHTMNLLLEDEIQNPS
jgi:hypothetical protein